MSLQSLIQQNTEISKIATYLNQLSNVQRIAEIRALRKQEQKSLFVLAKDSEPLDLEFFAPMSSMGKEIIHEGKNSLPAFTLFQKRFCRLEDQSVVGYNHGGTMKLIGPGYFVAKETTSGGKWATDDPVVIDYYEVPSTKPISSWPDIKENGQGLQRLVYYHMHDFMRKVSNHVSIGVAYKNNSYSGNYFILSRQD